MNTFIIMVSKECVRAFEELKHNLVEESLLRLKELPIGLVQKLIPESLRINFVN